MTAEIPLHPIWAVFVTIRFPSVDGCGRGWCMGRAVSKGRFIKIVERELRNAGCNVGFSGDFLCVTPYELFKLSRKKEHIKSVNAFLQSGENFGCAIFY